jgi:trans-2,3-dihydro-3-hydroxyanthranilate isomerase
MNYEIDWIDAFTDIPFGGNGCAVVHNSAGLSDERCISLVRETSLVECSFTSPSTIADFRVRYFLYNREIPFAGHPTLATVASLRHRGLIGDGTVILETKAGLVPVKIDDGLITMTQIAPNFGAYVPATLVAPIGTISVRDIVHQPRLVSTGLQFCVCVVKDRATLEAVRLDTVALRAYFDYLELQEGNAMEPFWITQFGATSDGDSYSRLLLTPPGPLEDPFTGSATGAMAAYLWSEGLIEKPAFIAEQGHGMGRPGKALVEVLGARDAITGVAVSGRAHVLFSGNLYL